MVHSTRRLILVLCFMLALPALLAQEAVQWTAVLPATWLQGYAAAVSGELLVYPWAYPGQTRSLLTRATDGTKTIEWTGAPTPAGDPDSPITYLWNAGMASGYGAHPFTLFVNGQACATFASGRTTEDREWTMHGQHGAVLSFMTTRVGTFKELFGFMWITAPRAFFMQGSDGAPRFRVVGAAAGSQDYYMTFQEPVASWARVRPEEAVFTGNRRAVRIEVSHLGVRQPATVKAGSTVVWTGTVGPGYTGVMVPVGPNQQATLAMSMTIGDHEVLQQALQLAPVRPRVIHLLPHSHIDIGYSDPQPVVEKKQWKNLGDAVALGRATESNPAGARFKWNVEGLWSVCTKMRMRPPSNGGSRWEGLK